MFSRGFYVIILGLTLINILVYCLHDFSFRIYINNPETEKLNEVLFYIELLCNFFFCVEMILNILAHGLILNHNSYLRNAWNCVNFLIVISSFLTYIENNEVSEIFKTIRLTRVIQIIYLFPCKTKYKKKLLTLFSFKINDQLLCFIISQQRKCHFQLVLFFRFILNFGPEFI